MKKFPLFIIVFTLTLAALPLHKAYAIFSPTISSNVEAIRQHAIKARQQNGTGGAVQAGQKLFDKTTVEKLNAEDEKARAEGKAVSLPAQYNQFNSEFKQDAMADALASYADSLSLIFNYLPEQTVSAEKGSKRPGTYITSCLRDDIFELMKMRDAIAREALRSALLSNRGDASVLWQDYKDLRGMIQTLKTRYDDPEANLFLKGQQNYYTDCPYGGFWGEFEIAFETLKNSWDGLKVMGSGKTGKWGNIWEMAKANAKARAAAWVTKNQIKLTIGGEKGGNGDSLIKGPAFDGGVSAMFQRQWAEIKAVVGSPIVSLLENPAAYNKLNPNQVRNVTEIAQELQRTLAESNTLLTQAETAVRFNLEFNGITEENTVALERKLFEINMEIKRASEAFGSQGGPGVPTLCDTVTVLLKRQCSNKGSDVPACK